MLQGAQAGKLLEMLHQNSEQQLIQKLNSQTRWCSLGSKPEKLSAGRAVWQIVRGVTSEF